MGKFWEKTTEPANGVLAGRRTVSKANHPRVTEPTAATLLAQKPRTEPCVAADASVLEALCLLPDGGAVAVLTDGELSGVFSEGDYARHGLLGNRSPTNTKVADIMTPSPDRVPPTASVAECLALMAEKGLRHLPVFDQGRLVGLLSRTELLEARLTFHERVFHETELDQKLLFLRGTYSC